MKVLNFLVLNIMNIILGFNRIQWYGIILLVLGLAFYFLAGKSFSGFLGGLFKAVGTLLTWVGLLFYLIDHLNRSY